MNQSDAATFEEALEGLLSIYDKKLSQTIARIWWEALKEKPLAEILAAFSRHVETSRFAPTPADIRNFAGANDHGHLQPEEAWNRAPKAESDGGWVTDEIMAALGACMDSIERGDMIGARKAFLERYTSELAQVEDKPRWWLTRPIGLTYEALQAFDEQAILTAPKDSTMLSLSEARTIGSGQTPSALPKPDTHSACTSRERKMSQRKNDLRRLSDHLLGVRTMMPPAPEVDE